MGKKYDPLQSYLEQIPNHDAEIVLSFAQIESIIGANLPPDAYNPKGTWWQNTRDEKRPQATAWLATGWEKFSVDRQRQQVTFRRQD